LIHRLACFIKQLLSWVLLIRLIPLNWISRHSKMICLCI